MVGDSTKRRRRPWLFSCIACTSRLRDDWVVRTRRDTTSAGDVPMWGWSLISWTEGSLPLADLNSRSHVFIWARTAASSPSAMVPVGGKTNNRTTKTGYSLSRSPTCSSTHIHSPWLLISYLSRGGHASFLPLPLIRSHGLGSLLSSIRRERRRGAHVPVC